MIAIFTILESPLMWWCFVAIFFYLGDCIIRYAPPLKKWRAMEKGAQPPRWAVAIQHTGVFLAYIPVMPAFVVTFCLLTVPETIIVTVPKWHIVIIICATVCMFKVIRKHTTCIVSELLSQQFSLEQLEKIKTETKKEITGGKRYIHRNQLAGWFDNSIHYDRIKKHQATLQIIETMIFKKKQSLQN